MYIFTYSFYEKINTTPFLTFYFRSSWSVRNVAPMIDLLDTWKPAIPSWVMTNILDQLVLPRLLEEVENWNPLTDTMPIHCWLHPWLPLMGKGKTFVSLNYSAPYSYLDCLYRYPVHTDSFIKFHFLILYIVSKEKSLLSTYI